MNALAGLALAGLLAASPVAMAQQRPQRAPAPQAAPPVTQPVPPVDAPGPVYEARLLRLAEIMGALSFMADLCQPSTTVPPPAEAWRARMRDLMDAEGQTPVMKERLAGAYNRGVTGYRAGYRSCTASGRLAVERLLNEGATLAHDLAGRYGS